tara:strand:- start:1083 stop:1322 length:240 start_codon:yes stop_codon:yes gene_type:complete
MNNLTKETMTKKEDIKNIAKIKCAINDGSSMYQRDSNEAFENAKLKGLNDPGEYMYMYSQSNKDYFKNIMFRNYINFNQ